MPRPTAPAAGTYTLFSFNSRRARPYHGGFPGFTRFHTFQKVEVVGAGNSLNKNKLGALPELPQHGETARAAGGLARAPESEFGLPWAVLFVVPNLHSPGADSQKSPQTHLRCVWADFCELNPPAPRADWRVPQKANSGSHGQFFVVPDLHSPGADSQESPQTHLRCVWADFAS